jgi:thiol-disulfide isomerase/thioredoxin
VTDHGSFNAIDALETRIVLWGADASVSVRELRQMLRTLRRGVRVVALMSQCFSGAFAGLLYDDGSRMPEPNVCGYFSSRHDRPAYGCYAKLSGSDDVGHSFAFLRALARSGGFDDAHRAALVTDRTPDVPLRTSDLWLQQLLAELSTTAHVNLVEFVDTLLAQAWKNRAAWEPEIRLLDSIGQTYGLTSPRSTRELQETARQLSHVLHQMKTYADAWSEAMTGVTQANQDAFLARAPTWAPWLDEAWLNPLSAPQRRVLSAEMLRQFNAFTSLDGTAGWTKPIFDLADASDALVYRTEIRVAALLRMDALLSSIAGRVYLGSHAEQPLLAAYRTTRACEGLTLASLRAAGATMPPDTPPPPMASFAEELRAVEEVAPAWTGLATRPLGAQQAALYNFPSGASAVMSIQASSPAADAGVLPGDVILGPPGKPFARPQDLLPWSMMLKVGEPQPLTFVRGRGSYTAMITPRAQPIAWSPIERPPPVGVPAPPLAGALYRGERRPIGRYLLFFWATWCEPCKAALPELLEFASRTNTPVVAVTDEARATLDQFFAHWRAPFPAIIVSDEVRRSFVDYGVRGSPTFVLIDEAGRIGGYHVGYARGSILALAAARGYLPRRGQQEDGKTGRREDH